MRPYSPAELFVTTGLFGPLIVLATMAIGAAIVAFMFVRPPRIVSVAAVAACLFPTAIGFGGMLVGRAHVDRLMAMLKSPTPRDRASGEREAEFCLLLGLDATLLLWGPAVISFARSRSSKKARP